MSWLLDTGVVSTLRRRSLADGNLLAWVDGQDPLAMYISVVTVMELERGVRLKERSDPAQGAILRTWLDGSVRSAFADRVLPIDERVAIRAAALHVPNPRPVQDAYIAATAEVSGLTIVTRNETDFAPMGVSLINPWAEE